MPKIEARMRTHVVKVAAEFLEQISREPGQGAGGNEIKLQICPGASKLEADGNVLLRYSRRAAKQAAYWTVSCPRVDKSRQRRGEPLTPGKELIFDL
jgi:hypothetical protein